MITYVIIHGSWQDSHGWRTVATLLKKTGFPVHLLDLPGHGAETGMSFQKINLHTYVNYVCQKIQELPPQTPVVLVGHSMAGMVISQVAQNVSVQQLVYVAAFLPVNGECLLDIAKRSPVAGLSKNMRIDRREKSIALDKNGLDQLFYQDCTPTVAEKAMARLQKEPLLPFYGAVRLTAEKFGKTPKNYIECVQDRSISIELQRFMHSRCPCRVYQLESGHAPFYSMPEPLARTLIEVAQ
jgi:pimeloyl-ACP methyl ester carboxylesterase